MNAPAQAVILFYTSNHAFRAEKLLHAQSYPCRLIPVPRHLSSECGVCLRVDAEQQEAVLVLLRGSKVEVAGVG